MDILELRGISKGFPDGEGNFRRVLSGIDLTVSEGEMACLTGPSGSGKTTLLKIMGTLLPADEGKLILSGREITSQSDLPSIRNSEIGFVFQDSRLLPQLTVLQNILLPTLAKEKTPSEETSKYALSLLEYTGIESLSHRYPETLSGGEKGRVALCRALVMKPGLILADEPTGQLDHDNAIRIASLLKRISRDFRTGVVCVTHSADVSALADRSISLEELNNRN